ncbi:type II toxin-antitoxin system VapC family toxin [Candidatus Woesearchaeota archaeon]|nr:type II toxin-antitoxin system VapC family toxin [Candidatus Woesearchaeota archaeon]
MEQKVCLDTDVCIEIIKGNEDVKAKLIQFSSLQLNVTSISVFELYLRKDNPGDIDDFLDGVDVIPFDEVSAKIASNVSKLLRRRGKLVDVRDIFIAAISMREDCNFITLNEKHFADIDGLKLIRI